MMLSTHGTRLRLLSGSTVFLWMTIACVALVVYGAASSGSAVYLLGLAGMAAIAVGAWRWPAWAAVFYAAFTPINRFAILLIFHFTGSAALAKGLLLWKEGLIAVLLARVIFDGFFSPRRARVRYLDLLVLFFIGLTALYVFYPGPQEIDLLTRIQGFRLDASFMFAYFVGRGLILQRRHLRWLLLALIPGSVAVAAVAAWQFVAPAQANAVFAYLGLQEFGQLTGAAATAVVRERGIAGINLVRASSLLLGDLALAFYQIQLVALAAVLYFEAKSERWRLISGSFLVLMIGTLTLTVTRSAVIAILPVLALTAIFARALVKLIMIGIACVVVALAVLVGSGIRYENLQGLVNPSEGSVQAHIQLLFSSAEVIQTEPLGHGLGSAGVIGRRSFGDSTINNENWYLQLSSEMGIVAGPLYVVIVLLVIIMAFRAYTRVHDPWLRILTLGVAGGGIGFLVEGNALHVWDNTVLSLLFWLLVGLAMRARELEADPSYRLNP